MRHLLGTMGSPRHRDSLTAVTAALLLFAILVIYLEQKPVSAWETALLWAWMSQPQAVQSACAGAAGRQVKPWPRTENYFNLLSSHST